MIYLSSDLSLGNNAKALSCHWSFSITKAMINDSNVRLRNKPNLKSKTWTLLKEGTALKIKDKSTSKETIDGEEYYWYKIEVDGFPDGWVYGKYITVKE